MCEHLRKELTDAFAEWRRVPQTEYQKTHNIRKADGVAAGVAILANIMQLTEDDIDKLLLMMTGIELAEDDEQ